MAKGAIAALGMVELLNRLPLHACIGCDDQLADACAILHHEGLIAQIDEDHSYLASVVTIDGAGGVDNRYAMLESKAAAWTYLAFLPVGQLDT